MIQGFRLEYEPGCSLGGCSGQVDHEVDILSIWLDPGRATIYHRDESPSGDGDRFRYEIRYAELR